MERGYIGSMHANSHTHMHKPIIPSWTHVSTIAGAWHSDPYNKLHATRPSRIDSATFNPLGKKSQNTLGGHLVAV